MPATRATASTSPLVIAPDAIFELVSGSMNTRHRATARRWLGSLAVTSTMRARPRGSRCVNSEATADQSRCACGYTRQPSRDSAVEVSRSVNHRGVSHLRKPHVTDGRRESLAADLAHGASGADEVDLTDVMPRPLRAHRARDRSREPVVEIRR